MSTLRLSQRVARRLPLQHHASHRHIHGSVFTRGTGLQSQGLRNVRQHQKRPWPFGSSSLHNLPAVRAISFARVMPKLALKLVRIPAMFGGAMIAGLAYIQYQAARRL